MRKRRGPLGVVIELLMPLTLVLGGVGLAALGIGQGSLLLVGTGLALAAAGVLWSVVTLALTSPFDLF